MTPTDGCTDEQTNRKHIMSPANWDRGIKSAYGGNAEKPELGL